MIKKAEALFLIVGICAYTLSSCSSNNQLKSGVTMRDIYEEVDSKIGGVVSSPVQIDDVSLVSSFQISPKDLEEYYGAISSEGPDTLLCIRCREGSGNRIHSCLKAYLKDLKNEYNTASIDYQKVLSGRILKREQCYFLIITGKANASTKNTLVDSATHFAEKTILTFFS